MSYGRFFVMGGFVFLVLISGAVYGLEVVWYPVYEGISHFVYNISVDGSGNVTLDVVFSNTSFDVSRLRNIRFYRLENITEVREVPVFAPRRYVYYARDNSTGRLVKRFRTKLVQNGTRRELKVRKGWRLLSPGASHKKFKRLKRSYGVQALKLNSKTWYRLEFDAPVQKLFKGWGSTGKVALELNGTEYHPWWSSSWSRRRAILVSNPGSYLDHYQLLLNLSKYPEMNPDCSDIRFVDSDNTTELPYWLENCTTSEVLVWVRVPDIPANGNKTIYLYYGNPSAQSASNGSAVFELFDDFSADLSGWVTKGVTISAERAVISSTSVSWSNYMYSKRVFDRTNYGYLLELDVRVLGSTGNYHETFIGFGSTGSGVSQPREAWYYNVGNMKYMDGSSGGIVTSEVPSTLWRHYSIRIDRNSGGLLAANFTTQTYTLTGSDNNMVVKINPYKGGAEVDNVIVRRYASPEPTYTVLQEEKPNITLSSASFTPFLNPGETANFSIHIDNPFSESTTVTLTVLDEHNNTVATRSTTLATGSGNVSFSVTLTTPGRYYFYWQAQSASTTGRYPEQGYEVGPKVLAPAFTRQFSVPEGVSLLTATVVWQGSINSSGALLELISPEQILIDRASDYSGKSFRSRLSMDVYSLPGFAYNITSYYGVERLSISSPVAGLWVLRVVDTNLSYFQVDWDVR